MAFLGWMSSLDGVDFGPGLAQPSTWQSLPGQSFGTPNLPGWFGDYVHIPEMTYAGGYGAEALWANTAMSLVIAGSGFQIRPDGTLISGTAGLIALADANFAHGFFLADVSLDVRALERAGATPDTADDMRLLVEALSGDDFIYVPDSDERQSLAGFGGDDLIVAGEGAARAQGGAGRDLVYGGASNDTLIGGAGGDILVGEAGNDQIFGGAGADVLGGRPGNDRLTGGAGADLFVFGSDFGRDRIMDFRAGQDRIAIVSSSGIEDVTIVGLAGGGSLLRVAGEGVIRLNVAPEQLSAADFLFGEAAREVADTTLLGFFDHWVYG